MLSEFRDISMNDRSVLLSNLHITESDIFEFPKHLGFFQDDVGYLRADNFLSELNYNPEKTRSNLRLEKVAWTGSYFDLIDTPYLDEFSNVFLQIDKNLSELAESEANRTAARENLGLSDMCTMSRSNVDIYGGVITDLTSIKTSELILNDIPVPETFQDTCFLKAADETGKATWALLPDATPNQKGVITLKNQFEQHDDASAYTSTFMREQILSITGEINLILIDTDAIDANINSNIDAIESLSNVVSVAIHHQPNGLDYRVTTLRSDFDLEVERSDDRYNEFILNNVTWFNNLSNLSITTDLHIDRVESDLSTAIVNVYNSILDTSVGQLSLRLDFEVETLNSNLEDEVDILNNRIDTEIVTLTNLVNTEASRLDTRIDTEIVILSNLVDTEASRLDTRINGIEDDIDDIKYSSSNTSLRSLQEELEDHIREYQLFYINVAGGSSDSNYLTYKVNLLYDDVYMNDGILDKLGDLNAFSNETSRDLEDVRDRVIVLETNYGHTSNDIIRIDQAIEDINDDFTSNLGRIVALESSKGYIEGDIQELRTLISDNDSNITANHYTIISVNTDLQIHKTHYDNLEGDVNSNIRKIIELEDSLWGTTDQNTFGVKGHLSNLQGDFDTHVLDITMQVATLSTRIEITDSNLEQTDKDLSSLSNVFENHLIHYGYLEKDVDSNIDRINALEHSLWGTDDSDPSGVRGELNSYMSYFDQHLLNYGNFKNYSESNIHDLDTRLQIVEGGSSNEQENLRLKVDHILPGNIQDVNTRVNDFEVRVNSIEEIANNNVGIVNTLSDSVYSLSNTLDTFSEDFESLSNILSNTTARLNQIRDKDTGEGILSTNTEDIRLLEKNLDSFKEDFNDFSNAINTSNIDFTEDISALSNIILSLTDESDGLSNLVSGLRSDLDTLDGYHTTTYSLAESLSNNIHDSHAGLIVRLDSNVSHTIRIHETDIPSIDSEISSIRADLGINDGGGSSSGTYLRKSAWDNWIGNPAYDGANHYKIFYEQVNGPGGSVGGIAAQINDIQASVAVNAGDISSLDTNLTKRIDDGLSSIKDVYTVPTSGDTPAMRLSVGLGRMYIQRTNSFGNWENLHIFR